MTNPFKITTFYKFIVLSDYVAMREPLLAFCKAQGVRGTILLAEEGINATLAASHAGIDAVLAHLRDDSRLSDLLSKESYADFQPFPRMKVRLKKEIVALRQPVDPTKEVGQYIDPQDWNELIAQPDVLLIDTRNSFEFEIGSFKGAVDPHTVSFSQFDSYVAENLDPTKHKRIAMFCTGGIRCEKATAYMLQQGFENVYHLNGGILNYLAQIPKEETSWYGECFVFDNRVTLDHDLKPGTFALCHGCWHPLSQEDLTTPQYEEGVTCPHCYEKLDERRRAGLRERQKQIILAQAKGQVHIGR